MPSTSSTNRLVTRFVVSLLVAGAIAIAAGGPARAEVLLRLKFKPGESLHFIVTQEMVQKLDMAGQPPTPVTTTSTMELTWKAVSVDKEGAATTAVTYDRIQMKTQGPQGVLMQYDSASDKEPEGMAKMVAPMFRSLVKKPLDARINARGEVLDVRVPPGLLESVKNLPGGEQIAEMLSAEGLQKMMSMGVLPAEPVSPGKSWTRKVDMKMPMFGTLTTETTYRYIGPERRDSRELQKIAVTMKMTSGGDQNAMIKIVKQESNGFLYFDASEGRFVETTVKMQMQNELNMMGKKGNLNTETTMHMTVRPDSKPVEPKP